MPGNYKKGKVMGKGKSEGPASKAIESSSKRGAGGKTSGPLKAKPGAKTEVPRSKAMGGKAMSKPKKSKKGMK